MEVQPLRDLGLTDGEIRVYTALISLGETTSGPLVEEAGVSLSKVYPILDRLAKKGLASHVMKKNTKHFRAADPSRLLVYLQEKQELLHQQESELNSVIKELEVRSESALTAQTVQVFDGLRGIQTARERTLKIMNAGDEMWIVGIARSPYDRLTPYFSEYHHRRYKKGIRCNYLYNDCAREPFGKASESYPLSEVRYMPEGMMTHAWMEIYADTITIGINYRKSFSIVIQNQDVADSFKVYARLLWSIASPSTGRAGSIKGKKIRAR